MITNPQNEGPISGPTYTSTYQLGSGQRSCMPTFGPTTQVPVQGRRGVRAREREREREREADRLWNRLSGRLAGQQIG